MLPVLVVGEEIGGLTIGEGQPDGSGYGHRRGGMRLGRGR